MCNFAWSRTSKFATNTEDTILQFKFQSLSKDQTESWIGIVSSIDKFVREAMPIQEDESIGKTRCKSETNKKTVINKRLEFHSYGTEIMD